MLLDKLWVRIRGEFLNFKDEFFEGGELRRKSEEFLEKLERRLAGDSPSGENAPDLDSRLQALREKLEQLRPASGQSEKTVEQQGEKRIPATLEELEQALEELLRLRAEKRSPSDQSQASPKNPRTLG
jgi:predicted nuclease with TOPRIM domain